MHDIDDEKLLSTLEEACTINNLFLDGMNSLYQHQTLSLTLHEETLSLIDQLLQRYNSLSIIHELSRDPDYSVQQKYVINVLKQWCDLLYKRLVFAREMELKLDMKIKGTKKYGFFAYTSDRRQANKMEKESIKLGKALNAQVHAMYQLPYSR